MSTPRIPALRNLLAHAALASLAVGCTADADADSVASDAEDAATASADSGDDTTATDDAPLYVISTSVFGPDSVATYLLAVPSLDAGTRADLTDAVEIGGFASIFGVHGDGTFFVGTEESPVLAKWRVAGDFIEPTGEELSFANTGMSGTATYPGYMSFAAPDKAYLLHQDYGSLVVWNPETMTIEGEVDLGIEPEGDLMPYAGEQIVLRPDGILLLGFYWRNYDTQRGGEHVRIVAVDTATDAVVASDDDRCGDNYSSVVGGDRTAYFSGGGASALVKDLLGDGYGAVPCMLRVVPPGSAYDEGYFVDLSTLTGGLPTGEFLLVDDETAFVRSFDASVVDAFDGDASAYVTQPGWSWWRWNLAESTATLVPDQVSSVTGGLRYRVDDRVFVTSSSADYSTTTLTELSADRGISPGITVDGYPYGVVRVR